jgi:hypothetical protein
MLSFLYCYENVGGDHVAVPQKVARGHSWAAVVVFTELSARFCRNSLTIYIKDIFYSSLGSVLNGRAR